MILPPSSLLSIKFFGGRIFLECRMVPLRSFSVLWHKNFSMKNINTPCFFLCIKFFDTRIFLKHRRVQLQNVSTLWDKKSSTGNRDTPSLLPLIYNIFGYQKFSGTQTVSCTKFLGTVTKKFSARNINNNRYSLLLKNFFDNRVFLKHRRVPLRNFSTLWDKKLWTRSRDTHCLLPLIL